MKLNSFYNRHLLSQGFCAFSSGFSKQNLIENVGLGLYHSHHIHFVWEECMWEWVISQLHVSVQSSQGNGPYVLLEVPSVFGRNNTEARRKLQCGSWKHSWPWCLDRTLWMYTCWQVILQLTSSAFSSVSTASQHKILNTHQYTSRHQFKERKSIHGSFPEDES